MKYLCHKQLKTWMWEHAIVTAWNLISKERFRFQAVTIACGTYCKKAHLRQLFIRWVHFQNRLLLRIAADQIFVVRERNCWKSMIVPVAYVHYILFRMQGKDTATEIIFLHRISDYTRVCPSSENKAKYSKDSTSY